MSKLSLNPYKGTRDFYPEDFALRKYIFDKWRQVCASFGYQEYDASVIEPLELYTAKTSEEIVSSQTFSFEDRGGRKITLRPEMTPSVSRMVAARRQQLGYPLRLFSIPNCFRYERMQRGRTREFWQLNVDLFGIEGIEAEVEMLLMASLLVTTFGADESMFEIRINSRKLLNQVIEDAKLKPGFTAPDVVRLIDAYDKLPKDEFNAKLSLLVNQPEVVTSFLNGGRLNTELETLLQRAKSLGLNNVKFSPSIARGFDYYTDIVFEVFDLSPENNRSMFGGGRYDGLVAQFGVEPIPTIGFGMGDATFYNFLESHNLMPKLNTQADIYLMVEDKADFAAAEQYALKLRAQGKKVAVDFSGRKTDKQFKNAKKLGFEDEQVIKFSTSQEMNIYNYVFIPSNKSKLVDLGSKKIYKYIADGFNFDISKMTIEGSHPGPGSVLVDRVCSFAIYVTGGAAKIKLNGKMIELGVGDVLFVPPKTEFSVEGDIEYITICNPPFFDEQLEVVKFKG